jgi:hypothetical protein
MTGPQRSTDSAEICGQTMVQMGTGASGENVGRRAPAPASGEPIRAYCRRTSHGTGSTSETGSRPVDDDVKLFFLLRGKIS